MNIYLSGPMMDMPDMNVPAFMEAAERLRSLGHMVINPAEIVPESSDTTWISFMKADLAVMLHSADTVAVLPGWKHSKEARIEVFLATALEMSILDAETLHPLRISYSYEILETIDENKKGANP